jgi:hypothetical protein
MNTLVNGRQESPAAVMPDQTREYYLRQVKALREELAYNATTLKNRVEMLLVYLEQLTR